MPAPGPVLDAGGAPALDGDLQRVRLGLHLQVRTVDDGAILCLAEGGGYLRTAKRFEDFEVELEFRYEPGTNSGIFFRWSDLKDPLHTGLEIQILDTYGQERLDRHSCGALYDLVAPETDATRPAGEWNQAALLCKGPFIEFELNGKRVLEVDIDQWEVPGRNPDGSGNKFKHAWAEMPRKGYLGLQDHGGRIWFRHIRLREM